MPLFKQHKTPATPDSAPPESGLGANDARKASAPRQVLGTWLLRALKAIVSIVLLYLLFRTISKDELLLAVQNANTTFILAAIALLPLNLAFQASRWFILLRTELPDVRLRDVFSSLLGGFSLGMITPGRVGELLRVFLLKAPSRVRLAGLHILDKLYFAGAVAAFGPLVIYLMPGFREALPDRLTGGIGVIASLLPLLYLAFALRPHPLKGILVAVQLSLGAKGRVLELLRAYDGVRTRDCLLASLVTVCQFLVIFSQFTLLSNAFERVHWGVAAHTYAASLFAKTTLPISLGSLGIGEWAAVSFYQRYHIAETTGLSASLLLFAINVLFPALLGLFVVNKINTFALGKRILNSKGKAA